MWAMIYSNLRKHKPDLHSFVYKCWRSLWSLPCHIWRQL